MTLKIYKMHEEEDSTGVGQVILTFGKSGVNLQVIGTFTGKIIPEGGVFEGQWTGLACINRADMEKITASTGITAPGMYWVPTAGLRVFRARIDSMASGSVTVYASAVSIPYGPPV